jgi:hypothetical protein
MKRAVSELTSTGGELRRIPTLINSKRLSHVSQKRHTVSKKRHRLVLSHLV